MAAASAFFCSQQSGGDLLVCGGNIDDPKDWSPVVIITPEWTDSDGGSKRGEFVANVGSRNF